MDWRTDDGLYTATQGRDGTHAMFPELVGAKDDDAIPDEMFRVKKGTDLGWPYTYYDGVHKTCLISPEYGGDGKTPATDGNYAILVAAFFQPRRPAVLDLVFYDGKQFPAMYRKGAFLAMHGGADAGETPEGQAGYNIVFVSFNGDKAGLPVTLADGFAGPLPSDKNLKSAAYRPVGVAVGPDGALFRGLMTCAHWAACSRATSRKRSTSTTAAPRAGESATCLVSEKRPLRNVLANRSGDCTCQPRSPRRLSPLSKPETRNQTLKSKRARLQTRLKTIRDRMDDAYDDKLDGKMTEEEWSRRIARRKTDEQSAELALASFKSHDSDDQALDAEKVFELANKAYSLYIQQNPEEQAKLLKMLSSNFTIDDVSATPTYRYPFDRIFERAKSEEWSGRLDSN